jgi:hypothetical protein
MSFERDQPGYYPEYSTLSQQSYWDRTTREVVKKRLAEPEPIRFFDAQEAATMQAIVDRILPQDDRTPERRIPILPTIDSRLFRGSIGGFRYDDMPSDRDAYKVGVPAIDTMALTLHGRSFHDLLARQQDEILKSLHDAEPLVGRQSWKNVNVERFWLILVQDCVEAYYAHPWAWDEIGYGGPAYPRAYMRLEGGKPEPWEKDEVRYEWTAPEGSLSDCYEPVGGKHSHQTHPGQEGTH